MQIINLQHTSLNLPPSIASIGFFDGVHLGHQYLIRDIVHRSQQAHLASMVITFAQHPRQVVQPEYVPQLITSYEQKIKKLEATGIDYCVVLAFDQQMASMTAKEFMQQILKEQLNVTQLLIGYDNRFGRNRTEGFADYCRYGEELGITVHEAQSYQEENIKMSSSLIREFLHQGEVLMAHRCLGNPYSLQGVVVDGFKEGRKLGFPTANLRTEDITQIIPQKGIYIVEVEVEGYKHRMQGMTNVGTRPTYGGTQLTIETHILDFAQNIYGKQITIFFLDRVRDELKFNSVEELQNKMKEDEEYTRKYFKRS